MKNKLEVSMVRILKQKKENITSKTKQNKMNQTTTTRNSRCYKTIIGKSRRSNNEH